MTSRMQADIAEIPAAVTRLLERSAAAIAKAGALLRSVDPPLLVTVARGSSDNAAWYFKYACEIAAGLPVASLGPSVASIYAGKMQLPGAVALAISQSGQSPDIVATLATAASGGAKTIAVVNAAASPLAARADLVIPLEAGPELSVAATKTFVSSVVAALALLAEWRRDASLRAALARLPEQLGRAIAQDWSAALEALSTASSLFVIGRGPSFAIALEAALKLKEVVGLHAEAFSGAELQHGPVSLVRERFPVLVFTAHDAARETLVEGAQRLAEQGAHLLVASAEPFGDVHLPIEESGHPLTDPLLAIVSFYRFVEELARRRGLDPDEPRNLRKVTQTL